MRRGAARVAALLAAPVLAGAAALAAAPAAGAAVAPMGQCTTSRNVVVAVDFGHWGGPIVRQCGTTPTTGWALLNQGVFHTTGTQHDGPAFVCRISRTPGSPGYPTPAQQACAQTPPASAYWSYWHADAGQDTWSYSQLGAMSTHPQPGSVDYWQFGGTDVAGTQGRPSVSPAQVRATNTTATGSGGSGSGSARGGSGGGSRGSAPHRAGASHGSSGGGSHGGAGAAPAGSRSTAGAGATHAASSGRTPTSAHASTSAGGRTSSPPAASGPASGSAPRVVDATPASRADRVRPRHNSVLAVLLGITLAVLLAAGAGWTVWRRRRAAAP